MRKIEFRGKRIDNGEWVYGFLLNDEMIIDSDSLEGFSDYGKGRFGCHVTSYRVSFETIGQYTGITDIINRKIYEGDIVRVLGAEKVFPIEYLRTSFVFRITPRSIRDISGFEGITIVGNIHEEELLERPGYMSYQNRKKVKIKLVRDGLHIQDLYAKYIIDLNVSLTNFRNMYYGTIRMRNNVGNAIVKFMGEPDETAID